MNRQILYVIPARSGSSRLPDKNLLPVGGVPLVRRAVLCAYGTMRLLPTCLGRVAVVTGGTDADVLRMESAANGKPGEQLAGTFVRRPMELAQGADATGYPHGLAAPLWALENLTPMPDVIVLLQPTSPLRSPMTVAQCVEINIATGESVLSCCETGVPNGAVYVTSARRLLQARNWGLATAHWVTMPRCQSIDIDCAYDLDRAESMLAKQTPQ